MLSGTEVIFSWTADGTTNIKNWWVYAGSTQGAKNFSDTGKLNGSATSRTVKRLPTDGRIVWIQLRWEIDKKWQSADFQYTAARK